MTRSLSLVTVLTLSGLTAGCLEGADGLTEVLPDDRLEINLPVDSAAKGDTDRDWATWYLATAEVTENVNGMVGTVLYWLDTITSSYPPSSVDGSGTAATWGPWSEGALDPVENLLWIEQDAETGAWDWGLDRWPKDASEEDASSVVLGEVDAGATREVSTGRFTIDFDTIHALDPTEEATGTFEVDYDIHETGVTAEAVFTDFDQENLDAVYFYDQEYGGNGMMDLLVESDLDPVSGTGALETWLVRSRWAEDGSGRADVVVSGGDLGSVTAEVTECWDTHFERVYYLDNYSGTEEGDVSACAFDEASYAE